VDALSARLAAVALLLLGTGAAAAEEKTIEVEGATRSYLVVASPQPVPRPRPVVMLLHGGFQTPEGFAALTGFPAFAAQHDAVAVFPRGIGRHWNDGRHDAGQSSADDVRFLTAVLETLVQGGVADPARLYVGGLSNGGMMTLRLACEGRTRLAGIAIVAANQPATWQCPAQRPLPAIFMHGTADTVMPWQGGEIELLWRRRGRVASAAATVAAWQRTNGCGAPEAERLPPAGGGDATTVTIERYACPPGRGLEHVVVEGGGHAWPGSRPSRFVTWLLGPATQALDANRELWRFFSAPVSSPP
jgi:polyhydroxybutyrate depolymerase